MTIEESLGRLRLTAPAGLALDVGLGTGLIDGYRLYDSPVGEVAVTFNPKGVSTVRLASEDFERDFLAGHGRRLVLANPPAGWDRKIGLAIESGRPGSLPLDLRGVSPFRQTIMGVAATIPRGQVRPYSWLAQEAGKPGAARAVGSAMSHNPVPLIVPCHRVVRADGQIGAYSLGGPENKWTLLRSEGADPATLQSQAEGGVRFVGSDTTRVFCYPTCADARRIGSAHRVSLTSAGLARQAGFRPCEKCRPA